MELLKELLKPKNLGGAAKEIHDIVSKGGQVNVIGAGDAEKVLMTAGMNTFLLFVCPDISVAELKINLFRQLDLKAELLPVKEDVLLHREISGGASTHERLRILSLLSKSLIDILVITPEALTGYVPKKYLIEAGTFSLTNSQLADIKYLSEKLVNAGYRRNESLMTGTFHVRGDTVDIYMPSQAVRIEMWGDTVESIKRFDRENYTLLENLGNINIIPIADIDYPVDKNGILSGDVTGIFDYMPGQSFIVLDEAHLINTKLDKLIEEHSSRVKTLAGRGEATAEHIHAILSKNQINDEIFKRPVISFQRTETGGDSHPVRVRSVPVSKYYLDREALARDIRLWRGNGYRVIICGRDAESSESIRNSLEEMEVGAEIIPVRLDRGAVFHSCKLVIIGTGEIINERKAHIRVSKKDVFTLPEAGDYIVHEIHGIGRCEGIVRMNAAVGERDYIKISYAGEDKLYVPVEQMNLLSRYAGGDVQPRLNKMGGVEFERIKERVRASVKAMAVDLLNLYNERERNRGFKYQEDTVFQEEFEDAFPYQETDDQLIAAQEIKQDMENGRIMDRLLVGDVGYGKTEVALRAVFKTVMDGRQAAILAPTTVLSQQHYNTCSERFKAWGLRVGCVNRFKTTAEIKQTLKLLEEHKIDVICGTHRLLSKDVKFARLGLLVLDEEQRFGVEQKELIKDLRKDINVLSLSATPIPRTLHMSLSGIRDISVLETAPAGRLPVETYVCAYSDALVIDAVRREKARDGQCFILYNRVESIENFSAHIKELLPDVNILFAHGQMQGTMLEDIISRFFEHKADVLISTTIIENGIDLPSANTLIVYDADRLGLSALYQLRGRVGRGSRLAYAYFTYDEGRVLTDSAYQRLSAIMDYTELGSGFKIAMRDLEIRGAGNILGREQHGHMEKVGYDLYCKLLGESIGELSGGKTAYNVNAEVKIDIEARIPETYIAEEKERMRVYRRLSALSGREKYDELLKELSGLYNKPPQAVLNLMKIALIRNLASAAGAALVYSNGKSAGIEFAGEAWKNAKIIDAVGVHNKCCFSGGTPPSVIFETKEMSAEQKNELILQFLNRINK